MSNQTYYLSITNSGFSIDGNDFQVDTRCSCGEIVTLNVIAGFVKVNPRGCLSVADWSKLRAHAIANIEAVHTCG